MIPRGAGSYEGRGTTEEEERLPGRTGEGTVPKKKRKAFKTSEGAGTIRVVLSSQDTMARLFKEAHNGRLPGSLEELNAWLATREGGTHV
jgi:hypothetical protein